MHKLVAGCLSFNSSLLKLIDCFNNMRIMVCLESICLTIIHVMYLIELMKTIYFNQNLLLKELSN